MARSRNKSRPVDWDALELEAYNLRFERMSPKEKAARARRLAVKFRKHNQPLPVDLATLLQGMTSARKPKPGSRPSLLDQILNNPSILRKR